MGLPGPKATKKSHPQISWPSGMVQHKDQAQGVPCCRSAFPWLMEGCPTFGFQQSPALTIPPHPYAGWHSGASLVIPPSQEYHGIPEKTHPAAVPTILPDFSSLEEYKISPVTQGLPGWAGRASSWYIKKPWCLESIVDRSRCTQETKYFLTWPGTRWPLRWGC